MSENNTIGPAGTGSRRTILELLKRQGPQDAQSLAEQIEVSAMAVRQHLYGLQENGFVDYLEEARPVGRPAKLWRLTAGAEAFFPDGHADLSVDLLNAMREAFGEAGLDRLVAVRAEAQQQIYRQRMAEDADLGERLQALAAARTDEGYMAEVLPGPDDGFLLVENHCPICAAAATCAGLCRAELEVFQAVLGEDVEIERTEHIPLGARRCAYQVRVKSMGLEPF